MEIGARGFPAQSLWKMLSGLGVKGQERQKAIKKLNLTAERSSSWLWLRRAETNWAANLTT